MPRRFFLRLLVISCLAALLLQVNWSSAIAQSPELTQQVVPLQPGTGSLPSPQTIGTTAASVFYPSHDAPVQQGAPNTTAPDNFYLGAGYYSDFPQGANGLVRSYIRFNLSSLPANSTISSATLQLYQAGGSDFPGQTRTVTFYRVTADWNETSITWNNRPGYAEAIGSVTTTYNFQGWLSLDLTNLVKGWVGGSQPNYGLVAIGPESIQGVYRVFASGETDHSPELHINYLPAPPPVLDASPGILSARVKSGQGPFGASVQISNVTLGSLDWTATKVGSVPWLNLDASGGSVTPTTPYNLGLTVNPTGLAPGTHTGQIRLSSSTPYVQSSPLTVTYTLDVVNQLSNVYLPIIMGGGGGSNSSKIVALVIGIADYQYLEPPPAPGDLPEVWGKDLFWSVKDATDFINWLKTDLQVSQNDIIALSDNAARYARVTGDFEELGTSAVSAFDELDQKEDENTLVIIYYSGHGGQTPDTNNDESDGYDEFIAMYDSNVGPNGFVKVVTDDHLQALLAKLESKHIVVIIDSCFSGGLAGAALQAAEVSKLNPRGLLSPFGSSPISAQGGISEIAQPGRVVIAGGTGNQLTWESAELQNGVFTYFFLQGLEDALDDVNQNGRISAEEAYWFTKDAVDDFIFTRQSVHQNPAISDQHFGQIDLTWLR